MSDGSSTDDDEAMIAADALMSDGNTTAEGTGTSSQAVDMAACKKTSHNTNTAMTNTDGGNSNAVFGANTYDADRHINKQPGMVTKASVPVAAGASGAVPGAYANTSAPKASASLRAGHKRKQDKPCCAAS